MRRGPAYLLVLGGYVVALWFERYGIRSATRAGDVGLYELRATAIAHGQIPYRNLYFEYPPGALAPIMAAEPFSNYATAFKIEMAVVGAGALVAAAVCLRDHARRWSGPLLVIAAAPLAVGSVFVNRLDAWPALLMAGALAFLIRGRPTPGFALLAAGAATKIFPVAAVPAATVWVFRAHGRGSLERALAAFAATGLLILLPFVALGPGGLRFSFTVQLERHLQIESLGGSLLLAAHKLSLYRPTIANGQLGSQDLYGTLPNVVATLSLVLVAVLVLWGALLLGRGGTGIDRTATAVVSSICAYVAFGKVLSPQYLVWLVPIVPVVRCRGRVLATAILLTALVLTQIEYDHLYGELTTGGAAIWVLLVRNLLLVSLAILLLQAARASAAPCSTPCRTTSRTG